uniref:CCHC-type domain-containing protein n=1 Tax=Heliothis virescens TaxID=7102 RepID=A0A2A4K3A2_HELVI
MADVSATTGSSIPIQKLKGIEDYNNWKFTMKMLLMHEDLDECIATEAGSSDKKKNQKALAKICLSVHTSAFPHVRNAKTAFEAWHNLQRAFEDKGLCRRLSLLRSLFGTKLGENTSMEGYLSKITNLSQQLSDIGFPLDDEFVAVLMLSGLTSDFDPLIMALENSNTKLHSDTVKGKLLQEFQRREEKEVTSHEVALVTKKQFRCFRCKKPGHAKRDCPKNDNSNKKQFNKVNTTSKEKALVSALSCLQAEGSGGCSQEVNSQAEGSGGCSQEKPDTNTTASEIQPTVSDSSNEVTLQSDGRKRHRKNICYYESDSEADNPLDETYIPEESSGDSESSAFMEAEDAEVAQMAAMLGAEILVLSMKHYLITGLVLMPQMWVIVWMPLGLINYPEMDDIGHACSTPISCF